MIAILYDKGDVALAGDKKSLTTAESFRVTKSFANLFKKTVELVKQHSREVVEDPERLLGIEKALSDFENQMKLNYVKCFLNSAEGNFTHLQKAVTTLQEAILDDRFVFEIQEDSSDWEMRIAITPTSVLSLLSTIMYSILIISTEFKDSMEYVLRNSEIVESM